MSTDLTTIDGFVPEYEETQLYARFLGALVPWELDDWKSACMSWKNGVSLHAGLSWEPDVLEVKGPGAQDFLSSICTNNVYKWKIGKCKHLVSCDEDGYVWQHCLAQRESEDTFTLWSGGDITDPRWGKDNFDLTITELTVFIFQISGPNSLTLLEEVTQQNLHDLKFLDTRNIKIPGYEEEFQVARMGMTGTLGYELRGPKELSVEMYDKVYQTGQKYGIKRLGYRDYGVNHTEGGFPQIAVNFMSSLAVEELAGELAGTQTSIPMSGSYDPQNIQARFRNPFEVGWGFCVSFDHDFIGREALEKIAANPKRSICTLKYNAEDVVDVYASQFEQGEEYKYMEFPFAPQMPAGGMANRVLKDGKVVGISSGAVYSYYYRCMISHCVIDIDQNEIGNEVVLEWGDYGKRIKNIRCTVEPFPFIDLPDAKSYDINTVPYGFEQ